jgi:DNA polymerase (family X)
MDKNRVAEILEEMGTLLELKGDNPFKIRAYHNAAQVISSLAVDLTALVKEKNLTSVKGIGPGLAEIITELVETGTARQYKELRSSFPSGILELLRVQGLGPKRIKILFEKLDIKSIPELKKACEGQKLRSIESFGAKIEENILKNLDYLERSSGKHLYSEAQTEANKILEDLRKVKEIKHSTFAGSLLRRKELIGDIDLLVSAPDNVRSKILNKFTTLDSVGSVISTGDTKSTVLLKSGIQCDLRVVKESEYPFALNYFTGSKEHNVELRSLARKKGWSLNEYRFSYIDGALSAKKREKIPVCKSEADIYNALGLHFIPPEIRENTGEIEYASKRSIPKLIDFEDLRGTFHCHTTESDGFNSLEQYIAEAKRLGWNYLGISDHSQAAAYAGGLPIDKIRAQMRKIDKLNEADPGFRIFKGTECEIFTDGSLDYSDKLLSELDFVVASVHSKFKMSEDEATKRIIKAIKNKYVSMLGHPTGRLLLEREAYPVNMKAVIDAAADYGKSIEINSHPSRLDLDWRFVRYAREKKIPIFINPDAHRVEGLSDVRYGIGIARKGWLGQDDVANTMGLKEITKYLRQLKGKQ